jgi:hypothetical protein
MKKYLRIIFFTKVPLGGYYKYKDVFQIFPADLEDMPKSSIQEHFPNILEYWISDEEKIHVPPEFEELKEMFSFTGAQILKQDKILGLLSSFTNSLFFRHADIIGNWGLPMLKDDPVEEVNSWSSMWCLGLFYFPSLAKQLQIDKFSELNINPIKKTDHKSYYMFEPNLDFKNDRNILFPNTIDLFFDSYFALEPTKKILVDAAISYTVAAIELKNTRKTLSLLASFTSMETMINLEFRELEAEKCKECGQLRYSVSKKFREYFLKYIGKSDLNKKKFNDYYSLRSKIVHTGRQLKTEILFADVPEIEENLELEQRMEILQMGKLAIVNWLIKNLHFEEYAVH